MSCRRASAVALGVGLLACGGDGRSTFEPGDGLVRFTVTNDLAAPITMSLDGSPYMGIAPGASSGVAIPVSARRLTWISAKTTDAAGTPIPDDIDTVVVSVGGVQSVLEITNVIGSDTYFTGRLFNRTSTTVSIGVFNGKSVSCAAVLPPESPAGPGFVLIGYYRLLDATDVRAYREPACTGSYVSWPKLHPASLEAKSGSVTLVLDSAP